ncbi:hypothetical protein AB833_23495 [Chromatiales bacterium (ex Bugula neritina AB1)]|nr:hypothetical protein AB833_23495 [Chromatiales bacterium (ex Bugula neritina AB1)]
MALGLSAISVTGVSPVHAKETATGESALMANGRFPVDPVTGATIYRAENLPADAAVSSEAIVATEGAQAKRFPFDPVTGASIYTTASSEPVSVDAAGASVAGSERFPFDPVTGATIYPSAKESSADADVRLPYDPVTGATIYPASSDAEPAPVTGKVTETASGSAGGSASPSVRFPFDPVTGATIYPTDDSSSSEPANEPANEPVSSATGSATGRLPFDQVTGATIYNAAENAVTDSATIAADDTTNIESAVANVVAEASESAPGTDSVRLPYDPVTGASIYAVVAMADIPSTGVVTDSGNTAMPRFPYDPVTGATVYTAAINPAELAVEVTNANVGYNLDGISRKIGRVFGVTSSVLLTSTDETSAKTALARLESASNSLMEVNETFATLPDAARNPLKTAIDSGLSRLNPLVDTTMTRQGVGSVLTPVITPMMDTLNGLAE